MTCGTTSIGCKDVFFDISAWLVYFMGDARGAKVREKLEASEAIYTCPMVIAEVTSKLARAHDVAHASRCVDFILGHAVVIDHTIDIGQAAGLIHREMKLKVPDFGMADAFIIAAARSKGTRVLTGDPHFKGISDAEMF